MTRDLRLFHISDQPGIARFEPRPAPGTDKPVVWAIDEYHVPNYLLPRDCPRVTFYADAESDPRDVETLLGPSGATHVVAVEACWLPRIRDARLIQYEFDPAAFEPLDPGAGYYVSRDAVAPIAETRIDDVLAALLECDVELRIMQSLWAIREAAIESSPQYSIIRMRNARPAPEGFVTRHPLP